VRLGAASPPPFRSSAIETLTVKTDVFDAGAIALAMITLSVFHPGALLPGPDKLAKSIYEMKDQESGGVYRPIEYR